MPILPTGPLPVLLTTRRVADTLTGSKRGHRSSDPSVNSSSHSPLYKNDSSLGIRGVNDPHTRSTATPDLSCLLATAHICEDLECEFLYLMEAQVSTGALDRGEQDLPRIRRCDSSHIGVDAVDVVCVAERLR